MANDFNVVGRTYNTVAASQTAQVLKSGTRTGSKNDLLRIVVIIPATTSPGAVTLIDNGVSITLFAGGATSVQALTPVYVELNARAQGQSGWAVTTGAAVSCICIGAF